jgi:hypothetical protein
MEPPPASTTDQLTPWLDELPTEAENVREAPVFKGVESPDTLTVSWATGGMLLPPPPPLPQAERQTARNRTTLLPVLRKTISIQPQIP